MGTVSGTGASAGMRWRTANVVVSVGPYPSTTTVPGQASRTRRTAAAGTTSPPVHTSRTPARWWGASSATSWKSPEVSHSPVTSCSVSTLPRVSASRSPGGATTAVPPDSRGTHTSYVEASKACGEWTSTRAWAPPAKDRSRASSTTSRWVTATPLGIPVEPEVCITYASRSACPAPKGSSAPPAGASVASARTAVTPSSCARGACSASVRTWETPASAVTCRSRSSGSPCRSGT
ncbi:hypothetical protein SVIOM342S_00377 [Streptomyces violaceorubidus]